MTIKCNGSPQLKINQWKFFKNKKLIKTSKMGIFTKSTVYSSDSGEYECEGFSEIEGFVAVNSSAIHIKVKGNDCFILYTYLNSMLSLKCLVHLSCLSCLRSFTVIWLSSNTIYLIFLSYLIFHKPMKN